MIPLAAAGTGRGWLIVAALAGALLLFGLGVGAGAWLAAGHYRPLLDTAGTDLTSCNSTRGNLLALMEEQGQHVRALAAQAAQRQVAVEQEVKLAKVDAQVDYAAANRIQQERTGGDQCQAATSVIDQELGL